MGLFPQKLKHVPHSCTFEKKKLTLYYNRIVIIFPEKKGMLGSAGIESFPQK